jgi:hypothetical protein
LLLAVWALHHYRLLERGRTEPAGNIRSRIECRMRSVIGEHCSRWQPDAAPAG